MAFSWRHIAASFASLAVFGSLMVGVAYADEGIGSESLAVGSPQAQEEGAVQASYVDTEGVVLFDSFVDDEYSEDPDLERYTNKLDDAEYAKTAHDDGHKYYAPVKLVKYTDDQGVVYYFAARSDDGTARLSLVDDAPAIVGEDGSVSETMVDVNVPARLTVGEDEFTVTSIGSGGGSKYVGYYEGASYNNYSAVSEVPVDGKASPYLLSSYYDTTARERWWQKNRGPNWPEHYYFGSLGGGMNIMNEGYRNSLTPDQDNTESNTQVFSGHVRSVSVPATVEEIGHRAFWHFSSEYVSFEAENSKLRVLNEQSFEENPNLKEVILPDDVKQLGTVVYKTFNNVTSADQDKANYYNESGLLGRYVTGDAPNNGYTTTNPEQIANIRSREVGAKKGYVFSNCSNLESFGAPATVSVMGPAIFNGTALRSFDVPSWVKASDFADIYIGMDAVSSVSIDGSNEELMSYNGVVYSKDESSIVYIPPQKEFIEGTPGGFTEIPANKFQSNLILTSVSLSDGITTIGNNAFNKASNLASISLPGTLVSIGNSAFSSCGKLTEISVPLSVVSIGTNVFNGDEALKRARIGLIAGGTMFRGCVNLQSVLIEGEGIATFKRGAGTVDTNTASYGVFGLKKGAEPREDAISIYFGDGVSSVADENSSTFKSSYFLSKKANIYGSSDAIKSFFTNSDGSINADNVSLKANGADVAVTYTDISDKIVKIGAGTDSAKAEGLPAEGESLEYTGSAITLDGIVLKYGEDVLVEGADYTVEYANNMKPGTATVTVKGMGDYVGTMSASFAIADTEDGKAAADEAAVKALVEDVAKLPAADEITADSPDAISAVEDAVSAYSGMNDVQKADIGADTLSALVVAQAKVAEAKQQIADEALQAEKEAKEAAQKEADEAKAQVEQLKADVEAAKASAAAGAKLSKPALTAKTKSKKKGKVTVAWSKVAGADGYELKAGKKTYAVKGGAKLSKTVKAKKGKKVKVQVRAFKAQGDNTVYSAWSAAKKVKVKK